MLSLQAEACPETLWLDKKSGFPFWQELLHTVGIVELISLEPGAESAQSYPPQVLMLSCEPEKPMSKEEFMAYAAEVYINAHSFIEGLSVAKLTEKHEKMSALLGRDVVNQYALMSMIRHTCYHLGACDAVLRGAGLKGVY